jgi:ribose transport system permease protein
LAVTRLGPVLMLAVLVIAVWIATPVFLSERNLQNVAIQSSTVAILAIGQLVVILTRGIDLSVGATVSLASVLGAMVFGTSFDAGVWVIAAMVGTGIAVGLLNGVIYVWGRVPHPFIVTLAMFNVAAGLALIISKGTPIYGMPDAVESIGTGFIGPIPIAALVAAGIALLVWVLLRRTIWGRWVYAIGGNPDAAERLGIPVGRMLISVYAICGAAAGAAAIIVSGQTAGGFPTVGQGEELTAIAAVIIGGASFNGGRGGVMNAIVGALTLAVIQNGLNLLGVNQFWQILVIGVVVVIAVELDVARGALENRFRALQVQARD